MRIHVLGKYYKNWVLMTHPTQQQRLFHHPILHGLAWPAGQCHGMNVHVPRPANARRVDGRGQKAQVKSSRVTFHVPSAGEKQDQYDTKQMQLVPVPGGNLAYR